MDASSAYESNAHEFLINRDQSPVGSSVVGKWAHELGANASVLELGCGGGYPITRVLYKAGVQIRAVDSSPTLVDVFKTRFPDIPVECATVQESSFLNQSFNATIAVGLVFLLPESDQPGLFSRVANCLLPGGRFLFTAPIEKGHWIDTSTGTTCRSLGKRVYERELTKVGLRILDNLTDEGDNNYYSTELLP